MAKSSFTGSGPRPLKVGDYTFLSEECPARLEIGGLSHEVVETKLYGGGKVTHPIGAQPKNVKWSGTFRDDWATKFTLFRGYSRAGREVPISHGDEHWYGIVVDIQPSLAYLEAGYSLELCITRGAAGQLDAPNVVASSTQIMALASGAAYDTVTVANLDTSATAAAAQGIQADAAALAAMVNPSNAGASVASLVASTQALLAKASSYASAVNSLDPRFLPISGAVDKLQSLAANVTGLQRASSITVYGGSLTAIAAQYCGDASKFIDLMAANGLASPRLPKGVATTLYIPQAIRSVTGAASAMGATA